MAQRLHGFDSESHIDREIALQRLRDVSPDHPIHALADVLRPGIPRTLTPQTQRRIEVALHVAFLALYMTWLARNNMILQWLGMACFFLLMTLRHAVGLFRPRRQVPRHAFDAFVVEAERSRATAAVGPILEFLPHAHHFGGEFHRDALHRALARLLPRLTIDEARALTAAQRAALRGLLTERIERRCPDDVVLAALLVLGTAQDRAALPEAVALARRPGDARLQEAAAECVRALGGRDALETL